MQAARYGRYICYFRAALWRPGSSQASSRRDPRRNACTIVALNSMTHLPVLMLNVCVRVVRAALPPCRAGPMAHVRGLFRSANTSAHFEFVFTPNVTGGRSLDTSRGGEEKQYQHDRRAESAWTFVGEQSAVCSSFFSSIPRITAWRRRVRGRTCVCGRERNLLHHVGASAVGAPSILEPSNSHSSSASVPRWSFSRRWALGWTTTSSHAAQLGAQPDLQAGED